MPDRTLFTGAYLREYLDDKRSEVSNAVKEVDPDDLQSQLEDDLVNKIVAQYTVVAPVLRKSGIEAYEPRDVPVVEIQFGERVTAKHTEVEFTVPYDGDGRLFDLRPDTHRLKAPTGRPLADCLILKVTHPTLDATAIRRAFDAELDLIESFLANVTEQVAAFNQQLPGHVVTKIQERRERLTADRQFADGLGFPIVKRGL